jgi:transmembrane sensor
VDDLNNELGSLRHKVVPEWGLARSERAYRELSRIRQRRRVRNVGVVAVFAVGALVLGALQLVWPHAVETAHVSKPSPVRVPAAAEQRLVEAEIVKDTPLLAVNEPEVIHGGRRARLADGSVAEVTTPQGSLAVDINLPDHVSMRLAAGAAHFEVVPNTQRRFSVFAGGVEVVVVGTVFDVERSDDRVHVAVSHGKVRVRTATGTAFVQGGEARWFESSKRAEEVAPVPVREAHRPQPSAAAKARASARAAESESNAWRDLSRTGDYDAAYQLLAHGAQVANDPESLMEAADAARLSNHPETAALYLQKVIVQHRSSPATPLAAFTLGRVLLERLGRPAEAAEAFATARELAPRGSLAQDALAREVESWSKAGHAKEAYDRSRTFMERYPDSRRLRVVQLYGGIETR